VYHVTGDDRLEGVGNLSSVLRGRRRDHPRQPGQVPGPFLPSLELCLVVVGMASACHIRIAFSGYTCILPGKFDNALRPHLLKFLLKCHLALGTISQLLFWK
jgi:hypothetical protein